MAVQRLSKRAAADALGVSDRTLHRMIKRGELNTEREGPAANDRVWVLIDESKAKPQGPQAQAGDVPAVMPSAVTPEMPDLTDDRRVELLTLQVQHLEELSAYRAQLLQEAELRYHELLQQFNRILPAPKEKRRRWWPFGRG